MATLDPDPDVMHPYIRPRDAATLIMVRDGKEILMGVRSQKHAFMPNKYVFPGGRVDRVDGMVPRPVDLKGHVAQKLELAASTNRARALAMAAVRETYEEAGLILGHKGEAPMPRTSSESWQKFYGSGYVPALDRLEYVARAITPPGRPRRFDARFFMVNADHVDGNVVGNGELLNLTWVPVKDARDLDLPNVTKFVIGILEKRLNGTMPKGAGVPFIRHLRGKSIYSEQ